MTFRIIFGTCLFPVVTLWQRHSISIYLASRKAQATTCKHVNTYDRTQDNCNLQENTGAKHHDHFPIGHPALPQFLILNVTSSVKQKASCKLTPKVQKGWFCKWTCHACTVQTTSWYHTHSYSSPTSKYPTHAHDAHENRNIQINKETL